MFYEAYSEIAQMFDYNNNADKQALDELLPLVKEGWLDGSIC